MFVEDLIEKLKKLDPKAIVVVTTDNFEQGHAEKRAKYIREFNGEFKNETFRDAFDGDTYSSEVVRYDEKGKTKFVKIS
jgi:hypothetical protein